MRIDTRIISAQTIGLLSLLPGVMASKTAATCPGWAQQRLERSVRPQPYVEIDKPMVKSRPLGNTVVFRRRVVLVARRLKLMRTKKNCSVEILPAAPQRCFGSQPFPWEETDVRRRARAG